MPPLPYIQVAEPEVAGCNENVDEDHSFSLRLLVAAPGDLDCDLDACAFFLHLVWDGLGGEAGYGEGLCVVEFLELCVCR